MWSDSEQAEWLRAAYEEMDRQGRELELCEDSPDVEPEVCQGCGRYFDYRGGDQLCWKCRKR